MKKLLLSLLITFFTGFAFSQSSFEINFGTNNHDIGYSIQQISGGKFIAVGTSVDSVSGNTNIYLAKIDTDGTLLWTKMIGDTLDDIASQVIETSDSGFVICGSTENHSIGNSDMFMVRTDVNGDTLWTKIFGGTDYDYGNSVNHTFDGGYILAGQESSTNLGVANAYLVKTNSLGDTSWTRSYPFGAWAGVIDAFQTPDTGYFAFGDFENNVTGLGDYDLVCFKMDSLGDTLWTKIFLDTLYHDYALSAKHTVEGGMVIVSQREAVFAAEPFSSKIFKLDAYGDTVWTKVLGVTYDYSATDIAQSADSGYLLTGYSFDPNLMEPILFITKLNAAGDSLWTVYHSGLYSSIGYSIDATNDGGIIVCGSTIDPANFFSDFYVLKTDSIGNIFICQPFITSHPSDSTIYENDDASYFISATNAVSYQWQVYAAGVYTDLSDDTTYSGTNSDTLHISAATLAMDGNLYRCVVHDNNACADTSILVALFVNSTIGINEYASANFTVFPNPASNKITISGNTPSAIVLYDMYGKTVGEFINTNSLDVSSLPPGIYILNLQSSEKASRKIFRILKN